MAVILVTGGMGFIGSNFIHYWKKQHPQDHMINVDLLTYAGNKDNVAALEGQVGYQFVYGDIGNEAFINELMKRGVDVVVHFAAESHVDRSIHSPRGFVVTNVVGTQCLLEAARKHQVKKFIHISTDEVYGSLGEEGAFTETTPLAPNSPYSASKAGSDLLVRAYYETYGFPAVITRCSNNYGPRQFPEKLIPMTITRALRNESIPIYGDGRNIRDWLYVDDHCSAIERVIMDGVPGEVYNIGGQNERSNLNVVKSILKELNKSEDLIQFVADRLGHDRRYAIDSTKIRCQLGWEPSYSFETGLKKTIDWYVQENEWFASIANGSYRQIKEAGLT
ncbi:MULTISPECIES: dTDP-glucose 4,6-dehydratase [unclassified Paenibacillus]|uniref:dTDP-glucose 4,6-dehydratase n=1 Tax=unclassified Paenibacillus TaxID=185978 RepID=UPI00070B14DD|nr:MULTISPECIES: dTDP-glucose 4,6-dehydratase [unclassified Paenibacillus]KQX49180.1 dTDP-glucose 4,6-dehydratase [Paenibacillus sp. Root444D2]KRE48644.1 dTDP-glucose 4,6-dehydratase [Paenibacillus sp. Soil724D2]